MSGKKDTYHIDLVNALPAKSRKDVPAGSKSARRGSALTTKAAKSRREARSGR